MIFHLPSLCLVVPFAHHIGLWVNGKLVGAGHGRPTHPAAGFEAALRPGRNTLAAEVTDSRDLVRYFRFSFLVDGLYTSGLVSQLAFSNGARCWTGPTWRALAVRSLDAAPVDWATLGFDDDAWPAADRIYPLSQAPWLLDTTAGCGCGGGAATPDAAPMTAAARELASSLGLQLDREVVDSPRHAWVTHDHGLAARRAELEPEAALGDTDIEGAEVPRFDFEGLDSKTVDIDLTSFQHYTAFFNGVQLGLGDFFEGGPTADSYQRVPVRQGINCLAVCVGDEPSGSTTGTLTLFRYIFQCTGVATPAGFILVCSAHSLPSPPPHTT